MEIICLQQLVLLGLSLLRLMESIGLKLHLDQHLLLMESLLFDKILVKNSGKICSMRAIKYDFCLRLNPTVYFPFLRNRHSKVVSYSYLKS